MAFRVFCADLEPSSRAGSADNSRRNKRKNFRPRNIVYSTNDDSDTENDRNASPIVINRNNINASDAGGGNNLPMDLSVPAGVVASGGNSRLADGGDTDGSDSEGAATSMTATATQSLRPYGGGLSVVRPEILFGRREEERRRRQDDNEEDDDNNIEADRDSPVNNPPLSLLSSAAGKANPLYLLSTFAGKSGALSPFFKSDDSASHSMREAFREVLKLYGMSSEMADSIMQNSEHSNSSNKSAGRREG